MEELTRSGYFKAVADITTTELADDLLGGVCSAGADRLTAAAEAGVPQLVSPGALDIVNFGPLTSVPEQFRGRKLYQHNPHVTLMRTSPDECAELGELLAVKLNASTGPVAVLLPLQGLSQISGPGQPFHDPVADKVLFGTLTEHLRDDIPVHEVDADINDPRVARLAAEQLQAWLSEKGEPARWNAMTYSQPSEQN